MNRAATRALFAALALSTLCGCAVDEQQEVRAYREVLDQGSAAPAPASDPATDPLTVIESLRMANAASEQLAIAGEEYVQAIINKRRAAATFLPSFTLNPSYLIEEDTDERGDGNGTRTAAEVPIDARLAFNMVRDLASVRAASADIETSRALLRDVQDSLLIDVARAYYEVLRAERSAAVLENSLRVQEERVRDARVRSEAGVARPLDVSLSESQAAGTRVSLIQARADVHTARSVLQFLMASPVGSRPLVDALESPDSVDDAQILVERGLLKRQDLLAADRSIVAASHLVESAYGQYFPSIALNLSYFLSRDTEPTDLDWTSLVTLSLPLFSQGLIEADVRTALSQLRQARSTRSLLARQVERDVEVAHSNLVTSWARVDELRVRVQAAGDALRQAEGLYRAGLGTNLEQLTAQDDLLTAELDLTNAELDRKVFYLDLLRASGGLHELIGLTRGERVAAPTTPSEAPTP